MNYLRKAAGVIAALALLVTLAGWAPSAEAALIGTKEEIEIGRKYGAQLEKQYGLVNDPELQARVARIGARIAAVSDRRDIAYSVKVLNDKEVNALALPGGYIYLFKGLVDYMPTDDELAGIIGHETGHVAKRHTVRQMEKSLGMSIIFGLIFGDRGVFLQNLAYNAIMAGYSREDEREADQLGFRYSLAAGFNPYSMLMGLQRLNELERKGSYGLFSTHPEPEVRVGLVSGYLGAAKIHPKVVMKNGAAQVVDDNLALPPLYATYRGSKPYYRGHLAAGSLYLAMRQADFSGDRFILDSDGTYITVYYDDREIVTLTPQDASSNGTDLSELARRYVDLLKDWAAKAK